MTQQQSITNQRLSGTQQWPFNPTNDAAENNADITIDRTINGGLNSLPLGSTLTVNFDRSDDGGATWISDVAGSTYEGGTFVTKGVTLSTEELAVGIPSVGTVFRVTTIASTPVRISASVVYGTI